MQFLTSLFGGSGNIWLTALFALGVVILLIVIVLWLLRLLSGTTARAGRGRNRRLMLVDSLNLDPKRQLLIVRRDDVEHLILTGGPSDVVVETGIPVEEATAQAVPPRRGFIPARTSVPAQRTQPAPATHVEPAIESAPAAETVAHETPAASEHASNVSPLDRLRAAASPRRNGARRHPGLRDEPVLPQQAQNSGNADHDSAKESGQDDGGAEADSEDDNAQAQAEGRARDGG